MFEWNHYVPVVRWKASERDALLNLGSSVQQNMTPLIEIVPRFSHSKTAEEQIRDTVEKIVPDIYKIRGQRPFFLSFTHIKSILKPYELAAAYEVICKRAKELKLDTSKFNSCLDGATKKAQVEADTKEGQGVGVSLEPIAGVNSAPDSRGTGHTGLPHTDDRTPNLSQHPYSWGGRPSRTNPDDSHCSMTHSASSI